MHPLSPSLRLKDYTVSGKGSEIGMGTTEKGRKRGRGRKREREESRKRKGRKNYSSSLPIFKGFL